MRNLLKYPVTYKEKIALIEYYATQFEMLMDKPDSPVGSMEGVILEQILEDLYRLNDLLE